jgi:hypothetical protein
MLKRLADSGFVNYNIPLVYPGGMILVSCYSAIGWRNRRAEFANTSLVVTPDPWLLSPGDFTVRGRSFHGYADSFRYSDLSATAVGIAYSSRSGKV